MDLHKITNSEILLKIYLSEIILWIMKNVCFYLWIINTHTPTIALTVNNVPKTYLSKISYYVGAFRKCSVKWNVINYIKY